jgi:hypothetical protein
MCAKRGLFSEGKRGKALPLPPPQNGWRRRKRAASWRLFRPAAVDSGRRGVECTEEELLGCFKKTKTCFFTIVQHSPSLALPFPSFPPSFRVGKGSKIDFFMLPSLSHFPRNVASRRRGVGRSVVSLTNVGGQNCDFCIIDAFSLSDCCHIA